jgi:hypothetical protein
VELSRALCGAVGRRRAVSSRICAEDRSAAAFHHAPRSTPFSTTNKGLSEDEIQNRLDRYGLPTDLPLVVQVSRFDKWKDPQGVIEAFRIARPQVEAEDWFDLIGSFEASFRLKGTSGG